MSNKARNTSGKFAAKSEVPRKVRSVNLTDTAWQWLAEVAAQAGVSRNDYLEAMAGGNVPLMETVSSQASLLMETVEAETRTDDADAVQQRDNNVLPLMETVSNAELDEARADYAKLLESSTHITNKLRYEVQELRSQLATERADREEIEAELADLKQNSVAASQDLPEAADLLNQLKAKRKKSAVTLADVEAILEMIEG